MSKYRFFVCILIINAVIVINLSSCTSEATVSSEDFLDNGDLTLNHTTDDNSTVVHTNVEFSSEINTSSNVTSSVPSHELCHRRTFYELIYRNICHIGPANQDAEDGSIEANVSPATRRIICSQRRLPDSAVNNSIPVVHIVNSSELLAQLGTRANSSIVGRCTVVLFYAPWCLFCARLAPHYNALARAFPSIDVVAIDAFHFSSLNSRFGTIAVPNIMVFHNAKAVARFNNTDRTLAIIAAFVANVTGVELDPLIVVTPEDEEGPLLSTVAAENDYLLILSWLFVITCACVACVRSATGRRVWNTLVALGNHGEGRQHLHLD